MLKIKSDGDRMDEEFEKNGKEKKVEKIKRLIESEVFDRTVLLTLGYFMNKKLIESVDFPISKGKEAYVFRATAGEKVKKDYGFDFIAIKIYMIETSQFKRMSSYIQGDKRFGDVKKSKRGIVYTWTRKEFRNLMICESAGVNAPKPIAFKDNILLMEYIGENGDPARLLHDIGPPEPEKNFNQIIGEIKKLYRNNLVHADISDFNILVKGNELFLIDIGQGVLRDHPMAEEFLTRDVRNMVKYFSKFGIKSNVDEILNKIKQIDKTNKK